MDKAHARCLYFGDAGFAGEHRGFGVSVRRIVVLDDDMIVVRDMGLPGAERNDPIRCEGREAVRRCFGSSVPYSPGYGKVRQEDRTGGHSLRRQSA